MHIVANPSLAAAANVEYPILEGLFWEMSQDLCAAWVLLVGYVRV